MKFDKITITFALLMSCCSALNGASKPTHTLATKKGSSTKPVLLIHGGVGYDRSEINPEIEKAMNAGMTQALLAGYARLEKNGTALDAVEAAVRVLEDNPEFNAGKGAVFTSEGKNELDASIMEGRTKAAGAVAGVTIVKNPISAARAVMEKSKHVLFVADGAEAFAKSVGLEIVDPSYFYTERRWNDLLAKRKQEGEDSFGLPKPKHWSTVGAVALDSFGNLAAGTSTGGLTNKKHGRVGDSPIIGAGTYADNEGAAVSCTGHGEYFIRYTVAQDINALVKYKNLSVQKAADTVIRKTLVNAGGEGAAIALDRKGNIAVSKNSDTLYRGWIKASGKPVVVLYEN